jgi:TetR/AcrR family transcriptional regulator, ethionamide resistance regulator
VSNPVRPFRRSPELRRHELSQHFINALEPILASKRYADLSVEDITAAGGIARSTFYAYFKDRGELLCAMADVVLDQIFAEGRNWWDFPDQGGIAELRKALVPPIEARMQHAAILGAVTEGAATDDRLRERQVRLIDKLTHDLAAHIVRAQQSGSASPDIDPKRTAKWLLWTFDRALYEVLTPSTSAPERRKLLDAVTMIIWRTLYAGFREP